MQKVLTAAEMREVDRLTTEKYGIPSLLLMENAAHAAARVITEKLGGSVKGKSILVLCGKGNNGGDGAALARVLWAEGANVEVCLIGLVDSTKGDARTNFEILRRITDLEGFEFDQADLAFEEITSLDEWLEYDSVNFHAEDPDVIVDALFGTGLSRPLDGVFEQVAAFIFAYNDYSSSPDTLVVSLDVPSGLNSDKADPIGISPRAHLTVTFTAPKPVNILPPASDFNGEVKVANIGSPQELIDNSPSQLYLAEKYDATAWLESTKFSDNSYKNKRGHTLLIAGSESYSGAAVLAGNAAMRSGVGLVTLCVPESCRVEIASRSLPDVIVRPISENAAGEVSENAFSENEEVLSAADAIALGCGLSAMDTGIEKFVRKIVEKRKTPVIVDAGALWFFNPPVGIPQTSEGQPPLIFTPHEGEFMRLLGTDDKDVIKDRVAAVRDFAAKHNVILVLKGERVLIGEPGGKVVVNPTGNSGIGKAGNGDTLTGILAGFVAQAVKMNVDTFATVVAAVYIAGLAGDIAERKYGKRVMTASDVRECLAEAFLQIGMRDEG